MAGGFSIKKENISLFKDFLIKNFKSSKIELSKNSNLYLDSIISPSALNEDFYSEINKLSPFGSGNNEPKFVIENLLVIKSNILGDKHIKSILQGNDGSIIKSLAFNATNSTLEPYLIKNRRKIHVAGKMHMNEWKGKKNIEFIIEDISLN